MRYNGLNGVCIRKEKKDGKEGDVKGSAETMVPGFGALFQSRQPS